MNRNLKMSFRNILKHKSLSLINVLGLAVGLASSVLILMHVSHEYGYDRNWNNADHIYRVSFDRYQNNELIFQSAKSLRGMASVLKEKVPEIVGSTQVFRDHVTVYNEENQIQDIRMFAADSTFFNVFNLDFIYKRSDKPLTGLYSAVLSESAARSLFGTADAVGKWFKVCQGWRFCVTGVYKDLPLNTHMPFDMLLSWITYAHFFQNWDNETGTEIIRRPDAYRTNRPISSWTWGYNGCYTYLFTQAGANPADIEAKIKQISVDYTKTIAQNDGKAEFHLQPIASIHLDSHLENEIVPNGDRSSVLVLVFIALVILCIAWINFINLSLVKAVEHAKSIGLRKIAGAQKKQLVVQFLVEALVVNFVSILISLVVVVIIKGWFATFCGMAITPVLNVKYIVVLIAVVGTGILVSGLYPAFYLSSYKPIDLFKGMQTHDKNKFDLRKFLVVVQFAASILLIAGVLTVYKQINYMKSRELGVDIEQTLETYTPPTMIGRPQRLSKLDTYKEQVREIAGVESITSSSLIPGNEIMWKRQDVRKPDDLPNDVKSYAYGYIDYDFIKTFGLNLIDGDDYSSTENETAKKVIVNEEAVKQLGFKNVASALHAPILVGEDTYEITGILKNFHQESLKKEIRPILFFYGYRWVSDIGYYSVKLDARELKSSIAQIKKIWHTVYPEDHFKYFFLDDEFDAQYKSDQAFGRMFTLFTCLAIFIASIGLFGLAVYSSNKRIKEIGIRKVNGASDSEILMLLNGNFLKWVAIAFVIAVPVAYYTLYRWLESFAYKTELNWWIFALAGLLAGGIALLTVSWQSWKVAIRNPVDALRYE